jgi:sec-independent protein translocase protein TatA
MGLDNPLHIAFLLIVLLLVFGARRLPEIGRSLGGGMREFKDSISGASSQPGITQTTQQQAPPMQAPVQPVAQQQAVPVPGQPVAQPAPVQPVQVAPQPVQPVQAPVQPVQPAPVQQQPEQAPAAPAQPAEPSQQA